MCKSDVNRLVVTHSVDESGAGTGNFTVTAPQSGYRVVSAFLNVEGASITTLDSWGAVPSNVLDSNFQPVHPYLDRVMFNYELSGAATVVGVVIFERADEPDVSLTQ